MSFNIIHKIRERHLLRHFYEQMFKHGLSMQNWDTNIFNRILGPFLTILAVDEAVLTILMYIDVRIGDL